MATNYGKEFEQQFQKDTSQIPNLFVLRLPDQQSGYFGTSQNICDFIAYKYPRIYFLELKSIKGNTFPFSNFKQFNKMMNLPVYDGIRKGLIVWFREHDRVIFFDISTIDKMIQDGLKSININKLDGYSYIEIPSVKKRTLLASNYTEVFDG